MFLTAVDILETFKGMGRVPDQRKGLMRFGFAEADIRDKMAGAIRFKTTGLGELWLEAFSPGEDFTRRSRRVPASVPAIDICIHYWTFKRTIAAIAKTSLAFNGLDLAVEGQQLVLRIIGTGTEYRFNQLVEAWPSSWLDTLETKPAEDPSDVENNFGASLDVSVKVPLVLICTEQNNHKASVMATNLIDTTGIYFQDLARAREVGALDEKDPNPKKAALYDLIDDWNQSQKPAEDNDISGLDLLALDKAEDEAIAQQVELAKQVKQANRKARQLKRPAGAAKSLDRGEVWPAEAIGFVRKGTFNGIALEAMANGGIKMEDWERYGFPTKRQLSQAIASISEKGYGVNKSPDGVYTIVLPEGLAAPKLAA